jgi:putative effector of murein hydrolase
MTALGTSVLACGITLVAYLIGLRLYQGSGGHPLLHPAITAIAAVMALLYLFEVDYAVYFGGAQPLHWMLGPAVVLLGVPLHIHLARTRDHPVRLVVALLSGAATATASAIGLAWLLGAETLVIRSLLPKTVTTPIAIVLSERIGGAPALSTGMVLMTGIIGCIAAEPLFRRLRIDDPRARGLALGVSAHGLGTAKAFEMGEIEGAYAALGLCLTGIVMAVSLPILVRIAAGAY